MKKIFFIIFMLVCANSFAQTYPYKQWHQGYTAPVNWNAIANDSKLDNQGNLVVVGLRDSSGSSTFFRGGLITKFKKQGGIDWTAFNPGYFVSLNSLRFYGVDIDNQNNIYAAGRSDSALNFAKKATLIKYSSNGNVLWEKHIGVDPFYKESGFNDVHIDGEGNIIASGYVVTTTGGSDSIKLLMVKFNPSGSVIWTQTFLSPILTMALGMNTRIATDNTSNIWMFYEGAINSGKGVVVMSKFNSNGTQIWTNYYQGTNNTRSDAVVDLKIGPDNNPVFYYVLQNNSPAFSNIFITKLHQTTFAEIFRNGYGVAFDQSEERPGNVTINSLNEVYFCMSSKTSDLTNYEGILYKLTPAGTQVWIKTFNTLQQSADYMTKIGLDNENNVYALAYSGAYVTGYVIRYDNSGNEKWKTNFQPYGFYNNYNNLHVGINKEIYLAFTNLPASRTAIQAYKFIQVPGQLSQPVRNVNKPITDLQDTYDTINVSGIPNSSVILNLQVKIDSVVHSYPHDLTFHITSPGGYKDSVIKEPGNFIPGTGFFRTQLADSAYRIIDSASNPFTGYYRPYRFLSAYNFLKAGGNWILRIRDNADGDTGTLYKWGLVITYYDSLLTEIKTVTVSNSNDPERFSLSQNYPNPFNPSTQINFQIPGESKVSMQIFDVTGRLVLTLINNESYEAGGHTVQFNASSLASGTYFYRLAAGDFVQTKKMLLIK